MHPVIPLFQKKVRFSARWLACLPILVLFSGCQFPYRSHSSKRVVATTESTRYVSDVSNGTTRTIDYPRKVVIDRGWIEQIPPGCVIHITESSFGKKRVAEVREKNGKPVLWMKSGGGFRLGTSRDLAWLEKFLWSLGTASSDAGTVEARIKRRMADPEDGDFLAPLGKLSSGSDKVAVLESVVGCAHLTSRQQVAVIQACFQHLSFSSDRTPVLLSLVRRPDFSAAAKNALRDRGESLSFDSGRSACHSSERVVTTILGTHNVRDVTDGTTRTINYSGKVVTDRGRIEQISPGCVIHITETSFGKKRVAEVREKNGKPVLWMKSGEGFRLGTSKDLAWLEKFLWSLGTASSDPGTVEARIKRRMADPEDGDFLAPLQELSSGSDKVAVLKSVVGCVHLTSRQQVAVIQACFQHSSFSSDRTPVLLSLVRRPDFSAAAKNALLDRAESLSFDSDRSAVLRALSAK